MERKIIGIVGHSGSGKDLVSDILQKHGFVSLRLSDAIRKYAEDHHVKVTSTNDLVNLGNLLRVKEGPDILPRLVAQSNEFKHTDRIVINGIRNPAEVNYLHEYHDAIIAGIVIPEEKIIQNLLDRKRVGDPSDREGILRMLAREKGGEGESGMNIEACLKMVDLRIANIGTKFDLEYETTSHLNEMGIKEMHARHGHEHLHH